MKALTACTIVFLLFGCATLPTPPPLTEIHLVEGVIYCQHSELNKDTRHYYIKSEAVTGVPSQFLLQAIYKIPGIANIYPSPYKFTVAICPVYSWDEIEPQIYARIKEYLSAYEKIEENPVEDKAKGL